ncbi:hypothetical protein C8J56DRAFT_941395 [Mycena floridula]|nr:hypothetical protein C8J56DRAFT_941395 [Mycena floridula]
MPFKIVRLLKRRNKIASNAVVGSPESICYDSLASFSQKMQGNTIRDINAPLLSNNQITNINHHYYRHAPTRSDSEDEEDYHKFQAADLILDSELRSDEIHEPQSQLVTGVVRDYTGRVVNIPGAKFQIRKYEGIAHTEEWHRDLALLSEIKCVISQVPSSRSCPVDRHPNIPQLYGICHSRRFRALVLHSFDAGRDVERYHASLIGHEFISYLIDVIEHFTGACQILLFHKASPAYCLASNAVDCSGNVIVDRFHTYGGSSFTYVPPIWLFTLGPISVVRWETLLFALRTQSFMRADIHQYYRLLAASTCTTTVMYTPSFNPEIRDVFRRVRIPLHGALEDPPKLHPPNTATYGLSRYSLDLLPDMSLRIAIPISDLRTLLILQDLQLKVKNYQGPETQFNICVSQIHHLMRRLKIDESDLPVLTVPFSVSCWICSQPVTGSESQRRQNPFEIEYDVLYLFFRGLVSGQPYVEWSSSPEGLDVIPNSELESAFGCVFHTNIMWLATRIPPQLFPILREIHEGCGFDADSMEMAEYLGYSIIQPGEEEPE